MAISPVSPAGLRRVLHGRHLLSPRLAALADVE